MKEDTPVFFQLIPSGGMAQAHPRGYVFLCHCPKPYHADMSEASTAAAQVSKQRLLKEWVIVV
jgi:hypothetical protein